LAIYKTQANSISKKKAEKEEEHKRYEGEKVTLEKQMRDKEETYAKAKGGKYMGRDSFKQYAANLRVKNANFKVMKKVLDEIKAEVVVLKRTE
jgi:intraflagellar transport protein 81